MMSITTEKLIQEVRLSLDTESGSKVEALLRDPKARLVDGAPTSEEVREVLPTLKARLTNSAHTGKQIFGLQKLVDRLVEMDALALIHGYGFISSRAAGNVYVDAQGRVLGAAVVDR